MVLPAECITCRILLEPSRTAGLMTGTQNIYRVRAVNDATNDNNGVGKWSTIVAGRTKAAE